MKNEIAKVGLAVLLLIVLETVGFVLVMIVLSSNDWVRVAAGVSWLFPVPFAAELDNEFLIKSSKRKAVSTIRWLSVATALIGLLPIALEFYFAGITIKSLAFVPTLIVFLLPFQLLIFPQNAGLEERIDCLKCAAKIQNAVKDKNRTRLVFGQYTDDEKSYIRERGVERLHPLCIQKILGEFDYYVWLADRYDHNYQLWFQNHI